MTDNPKARSEEIIINKLHPNPKQPRGVITPESIMELADSVKEHGILEPLIVAHTPAGYQIIAGERRWRAAKMAGLKSVPCIIRETTPKEMLEMTLVENVQREDLNPLERAKGFLRLREEFNFGTTEIAERIGKSPSYISNTLRLLQLPDAVKDGLLTDLISEGHARALLAIDDQSLMIEAYKTILRESASVRKAEDISRRIRVKINKGKKPEKQKKGRPRDIVLNEKIFKIKDNIEATLGKEKLRVDLKRTSKQTRLKITLYGDVKETEDKLEEIYQKLTNK